MSKASKHAHKVRKVIKHPAARLLLFLGAIVVSVIVLETFTHWSNGKLTLTTLSVSAVFNRGIEVITDVICDRLFPHVLE